MTPDNRPACATQHISPTHLSPGMLDDYLAHGWYRIGQHMIYCEYISWKQGMSGVIWTRVPLEGYTLSKSLRKKHRKIERHFEVTVHPARIDAAHRATYKKYLSVAPGERSQHLEDVLFGGQPDRGLFDTWEVEIVHRESGELAAFSWFDRGETSLQSIIGVYDPAYGSYGLGQYTMIREILMGIEYGLDHYYAGYILCDDEAMHYKLSTGHIEFLDRTRGEWVEEERLDVQEHDPIQRTHDALALAQQTQTFANWQFYSNRHFELSAYAPNLKSCLAYPLVLWHTESEHSPFVLVLAWDSVTARYELLRCLRGVLATPDGSVTIRDLFVVDRSLDHFDDLPYGELPEID